MILNISKTIKNRFKVLKKALESCAFNFTFYWQQNDWKTAPFKLNKGIKSTEIAADERNTETNLILQITNFGF